jgi:hypothetical protein
VGFPVRFPQAGSMTDEEGRLKAAFPASLCHDRRPKSKTPGALPGSKSGDEAREINEAGERRDPERGRPVAVMGQRQPAPRLCETETRSKRCGSICLYCGLDIGQELEHMNTCS